MKVIISGGGTGGHIFPAVAIANAIKNRLGEKTEILFIGAEGRMEMEKVPAAGYKIIGLPIAGLQRKLDLKNFILIFKVLNSLWKASKIISSFKPDVVVGVGGYASGPVLFAASLQGIPTLIQEQNSFAGITNKILGRRAKKICVAYEGMNQFFKEKKIVLTGNPVRKDVTKQSISKEEALNFFQLQPNKKTILVIGGSLGARTINESIAQNISAFSSNNIQLIWQTGKSYFAKAKEVVAINADVKVFDFINRMDMAYGAADLVISRAGALSISELCVLGKATVLVPSPNVSEDHQTKNAMALVNKNAAVLVKDMEAKEKLVATTISILNDENKLTDLKINILQLAMPNADEFICDEIIKLIKK
ncbi:MAG: undecaprenyldiphospho-muramoylpentapeptide beta-N-acetylglucosaminyltransferase [Sphingobacteriales bacterium]|nr:MAG: undecaprenyldiphospho-muramoylpentapeptide beta-N-acetylglucosaminyltransferase [Sphingobacteriales bacterium]